MKDLILKNILSKSRLAGRLSQVPQVTQYNTATDKEEWNITNCFAQIEESMADFNIHLGMLANQQDISKEQMAEILFETGEDLRNIVYQIQSMAYYDYLWDIE